MEIAPSPEQDELRTTVRSFLDQRSDHLEVRRVIDTNLGYDQVVWKSMAEQLGLHGIAIPERYGGSGGTWLELGIVLEEMGRALLPSPFFSTVVLAANTILLCDEDAVRADLLPKIASGDLIATLALQEGSARLDQEGIQTRATESADGWLLDGTKSFVPDGRVADLFLVAARTADDISLFAVGSGARGTSCEPLDTLDETRPQATLRLRRTPARLISAKGRGWETIEKVIDLAAVGIAAEQVGGAQRCLDMSVDYAKDRMQFGQPIGSFQAIKHKCANMLLDVESAKSAAYHACATAAHEADDLPAAASLAKAYCSEAFYEVAAETIQIHGGIGFTWEHPAHLYLRRAVSSAAMFGDPTFQRSLLAERLNI